MKIKNILLTGVAALTLTSCNDYLDVDAPSAYSEEFVFSQKSEIERALNGVYAQALVGDLYGNAYQQTFNYNSDVDIQISSDGSHEHNTYSRYDCDDEGSDILKFWTAAYNLVEYCNKFITSAENSPFYNNSESEQDAPQYLMMRAIRRSLSGRMSLTSSVLLKSLPTLICSRARTRRFTAVRQTAQVIIPIAGTPAAMFLSAKNNPSPFLKREITSVRLRTMLLGKRSIL